MIRLGNCATPPGSWIASGVLQVVAAELLAPSQEQALVYEFRDLFMESCLALGGRVLPDPTDDEIFERLATSRYTS
jgi:hypothetical protein